jgi:hypothetical protein
MHLRDRRAAFSSSPGAVNVEELLAVPEEPAPIIVNPPDSSCVVTSKSA